MLLGAVASCFYGRVGDAHEYKRTYNCTSNYNLELDYGGLIKLKSFDSQAIMMYFVYRR